jgi:hypothetical protein
VSSATFASLGGEVSVGNSMTLVLSKTLPAGSWAVVATSSIDSPAPFLGDFIRTTACQIRNGDSVIGSASDRRLIPDLQVTTASLTMNGGAFIASGTAQVSLWCSFQGGGGLAREGQMMFIQVGGFS